MDGLRRFCVIILLVGACGLSRVWGENDGEGQHLFILSGQSNMARLDPETSFAPAVREALGREKVIVVKDAHAGQAIRRWYQKWDDAGEAVKTPPGDLYEPLIQKVLQAVEGRKIRTVTLVWMQGESDAVLGRAARYEESLKGVITQLERDLKRNDIHLVLGRLSDCEGKKGSQSKGPDWAGIREIQMRLGESRPHSAWVDTDDLNDLLDENGKKIKDDLHYTAEGYKIFGTRLAQKSVELIGKGVP